MLYAEWDHKNVTIRDQWKTTVRRIRARKNVIGVQCSGDDTNDAMIAITLENGKTDLYRASGQLVRQG